MKDMFAPTPPPAKNNTDRTTDSVHGKIYYEAGRYNYGAIDSFDGDSSGGSTLISGIKPQKLNREFLRCIHLVQSESMMLVAAASLLGDSAHSEELYLYATNTQELYTSHFRPLICRLKAYFDSHGSTFESWRGKPYASFDLQSILRDVSNVFTLAARKYEEEFPKNRQGQWYNLTPLDCAMCAIQWTSQCEAEYKVNGLNGFES